MMLHVRARVAFLSLLLALSPGTASAQSKTEIQRAKELGTEGLSLYDQGDHAAALAKLDEADALAKAPPLGLYAARCLDKLGRLADAKQRYEDVSRIPLPPNSPPVWAEAKADAQRELAALSARVPVLTVEVRGLQGRDAELSIDGRARAPGERRFELNLGKHEIVLAVAELRQTRSIELSDGARETLVFDVPGASAGPTPITPEPASAPGPSALAIAGWVTFSAGVAGLAVWGGAGAAALVRSADAGCSDASCPTDSVDELQRLRTTSTVGFYVGAPLTAGGVVLLIVDAATRGSSGERAAVRPVLGPTWLGVEGTF